MTGAPYCGVCGPIVTALYKAYYSQLIQYQGDSERVALSSTNCFWQKPYFLILLNQVINDFVVLFIVIRKKCKTSRSRWCAGNHRGMMLKWQKNSISWWPSWIFDGHFSINFDQTWYTHIKRIYHMTFLWYRHLLFYSCIQQIYLFTPKAWKW